MTAKIYHVEKSSLKGLHKLMVINATKRGLTFNYDYSRYVGQTKVVVKGDGRRISRFAKDMWGWS